MAENTSTAETVRVTVAEDRKSTPKGGGGDQNTAAMGATSIKMQKLIVFPLTIISFLLSLPILFSVIWLLYMRHYDCENLLQLPKLQVGIVAGLVVVFFVSNIAVFLRSRLLMPALILVMVPLIVMLTVGLALVGAYKMESRSIPGSPMWLKSKVLSDESWNNIKSCIYDTRTCDDLIARSYVLKSYDFTTSKLSPIESGCCRPAANCDMVYVNATFWRKGNGVQVDSSTPYDIDCDLWTNDQTILCYNCHACKQGFLKTIKGKWWKLGVFLVVMAIFLIASHLLLFVITMWEHYGG
ncbi:hypothetical protein RJ639_040808 [Escallonia herrerae]|uniref:Tetraspanin-15 n=1 Tax=Escallonia herrerae TaxID=1293975 RepID=A0AA89BBT9_9ASTE|nr:hypothetical protein RJ639_040808 [Escallonia herrerae]